MPSDISYALDLDSVFKLYLDEDWMDEELIIGVEERPSNFSNGLEDYEDDLESEDFSDLDWLDDYEDESSSWSEMSYNRFNKNKIVYGQ